MRHLLLTLSFIFLVGCDDPVSNEGYDAGYELTCGYSWSAGNRLVVDKEFAYHFLAGARECAQQHPERARKVLGLASAKPVISARMADAPKGPATEEQRTQPEPSALASPPAETNEAAVKPKSPVKVETRAKTKARTKAKPPTKAKAPAKAKPPAKAKATAKAKPPKKAKSPAVAKPVTETSTPAKAAKASPVVDKTPAPKPTIQTRPVTAKPARRTERKKSIGTYESFMGE